MIANNIPKSFTLSTPCVDSRDNIILMNIGSCPTWVYIVLVGKNGDEGDGNDSNV